MHTSGVHCEGCDNNDQVGEVQQFKGFSASIAEEIIACVNTEPFDNPNEYEMATFDIIEEKFKSESWFEVAKSYVNNKRRQLSLVTVDALAGKS